MMITKKLKTPVNKRAKSSSIYGGSLEGTAIVTIDAVSTPVFLFKIVLATQFYM